MNSIDSSTDGLSWNQWLTVGLLLQKTTGEESCYAERDLFESVFRSWANYFDGQQLLSTSAAERWMSSFASEVAATTFGRSIFPLLDRDGDGYIQAHEFVLGMITLLKDTCCTPPPCPALVKSQRQMAFQHYDQDRDGLLGGPEWTRFVNDCLKETDEPKDYPMSANFGICVRGVTQCLAARDDNELTIARRVQPRTGLLWAEDFWIERRATINYDAFYEALERGMFSEPRKFMELDLLRPPLYRWVVANLKSQGGERGEDFSRLLSEGLKFTATVLTGVKETILPIIAQQAKAGFEQAISLMNPTEADSTSCNGPAQMPRHLPAQPLESLCIASEGDSPPTPLSEDVPSERSGPLFSEIEARTFRAAGHDNISISLPSTESPCKLDKSDVSKEVSQPVGVPSEMSKMHDRVTVPADLSAASVAATAAADPSPSDDQCQETRYRLVRIYIDQMAWLMSRDTKTPVDNNLSAADFLLLCESLGQRMLFAENICHRLEPSVAEEVTFIGEIGGDVERTRKIIREVCVEQSGYWRLPESSKVIFTGNILSTSSPIKEQTLQSTNNLNVLLTIWACKAVYPLNVFLLRGRNEACSHSLLLEECERKWGTVEGKQMWNVFLDTWEMAPLAYDIGGEGCVYGASLTGAVEAIWDGLGDLKRPLKIDVAETDPKKYDSDYVHSELWTSSDRAAMHCLEDKVKAVRESYTTRSSPDFIAAVIRLRTRFGFNWIIQDQFVTSTAKVEHSRWFDIARLHRSEEEATWVLDSYRGDLRERIWPSQQGEKSGKAVERDLAMVTTGDGVSPSPSTSEDIEKFLLPLS